VNSTGAIVAVIGAVIGGLSGAAALIRTFLERPKVRADAMTTVNAAALTTLDDIRKDASDLRQQVAALRAENRLCESRIDQLEDREDKYVRAIRLLAAYIGDMHNAFAKAGIVPPPEPISPKELERLLTRFAHETPGDGGPL
jgi:BMFP domain-containing protein YqiC